MKILILAPLPPYHEGGIERVVGEVAQRLAHSHDVDVWSGAIGRTRTCDWKGVNLRTYHASRRAAYASLGMFMDLKRWAGDFDVVHAHGSGTLIPFLAGLAADSSPLVLSPYFHPQTSNRFLGIIKPPFDRTVTAYNFRKATKIVCVSETEAEIIRRRFADTDRITVIFPGVNVEMIRDAKPYEFDGTLVLYVGRLERYKNIHSVLKAFKHLPKEFLFYIVGEGPYKNSLESFIDHNGLSDRIKLLGALPDAEVYRYLKTSAVLVNLSEVETFGITVLEALAAGTPALVNDRLGLSELAKRFNHAVFSIPATTNARELAQMIFDVAGTDIGLADLDDFRWDRTAARTVKVYEEAYAAQLER